MSLGKSARPLPPDPQKLVLRPRLFARLDGAGARPVFVSGPPGSGKSTLASSYVDQRGFADACVWYNVDDRDGDPGFTFNLGLPGAVRHLAPEARLPRYDPAEVQDLGAFSRHYFAALIDAVDHRGRDVLLVLDAFLPGTPLARALPALFDLPGQARVLVVSAFDPPCDPGLEARFGRQEAVLVGKDELLLTPDEAAELVDRHAVDLARAGVDPARARVELPRRAGGHAVSLLLLLQGRGARSVGAYLASLVPPAERELLHRLSLLPRFTVPMAAEVLALAPGEASALVEQWYAANLFLSRDPEDVYEFHSLFRAHLREGAPAALEAGLGEARRRAAAALEGTGHVEEAVRLYREAGDTGRATAAVLRLAPEYVAQGRVATVASWLAELPGEAVAADPALLHWQGACLRYLDPEAGVGLLRRALALREERGDLEGLARTWTALVDACLFLDQRAVLDDTTRLGPLLLGHPSPELRALAAVNMFCIASVRRPFDPETAAWEEAAAAVFDEPGLDPAVRVPLGCWLASYRSYTGRLEAASRVLAVLRAPAVQEFVREAQSATLDLAIREVQALQAFLEGRSADCLALVGEGLGIAAERGCEPSLAYHLWCHGASAALSVGDLAGFDDLWRLAPDPGDLPALERAYHFSLWAWERTLRGLTGEARQAAEQAWADAERSSHLLAQGIVVVTNALVLAGTPGADTGPWFERAAALVEGGPVPSAYLAFMLEMARAWAALHRGDGSELRERAARLMAIGQETGLANCHGWLPNLMARVCAEAIRSGRGEAYARHLLRLRDLRRPVEVYALRGEIQVIAAGEPVRGRTAAKRFDLLKLLVCRGRGGALAAADDGVAVALGSGDTQMDRLRFMANEVYRLRSAVGDKEFVVHESRLVRLDPELCWVDAFALDDLLDRPPAAGPAAERVLELYRRPLLDAEDDGPAGVPAAVADRRRALNRRVVRWVAAAAAGLGARGEAAAAADLCERALAVPGLDRVSPAEELYQELMSACLALGHRARGLEAYRDCQRHLPAPSPRTEELRQALEAR